MRQVPCMRVSDHMYAGVRSHILMSLRALIDQSEKPNLGLR